jgi:LacI family transcriptional regulator
MVLLGRRSASMRVHSLCFDHYAGACEAVRHLLELGHRRIAFINGPEGRHDAEERLRGYRDALHAAGLAYDERLVANGGYVESGGVHAMNTLIDRGAAFTAVFAANDDSAYGAILALHRRGLRVPDDISLVGYDNTALAALRHISLTTIHQPRLEMGQMAVATLLERLEEGRKRARRATLTPTLIVRGTTAPPPK